MSLHLLNLAEAQRAGSFLSTDVIPQVGPKVSLHVPEKPSRMRWVPDRRRLKWTWSGGILEVTVPWLHVHGAVVVS